MFFTGRDWETSQDRGKNENLLQSAQDLRLGLRFTFQQDNNPKHTAKTTQEWLRDKFLNILGVAKPEPGLEPDQTSLERP